MLIAFQVDNTLQQAAQTGVREPDLVQLFNRIPKILQAGSCRPFSLENDGCSFGLGQIRELLVIGIHHKHQGFNDFIPNPGSSPLRFQNPGSPRP